MDFFQTKANSLALSEGPNSTPKVIDRRLSWGLRRIGTSPIGIPLYKKRSMFSGRSQNYVMAQDLRECYPDTVKIGFMGFLRANQ